MTLGELLTALKNANPNAVVTTTHGYVPRAFVSYRPVPCDAALTTKPGNPITVSSLIHEIEATFARLTTGYGYLGCYRFHVDTRVWLANQGSCVRQGIGEVIDKGAEIILVPCYQE